MTCMLDQQKMEGKAMRARLLAIGALLAMSASTTALADPLTFTLTGAGFGADSPATFTLDRNPTPTRTSGDAFAIDDISVMVGGATKTYNIAFGGQSFPFINYSTAGDSELGTGSEALFTGPASSPTFSTGDFSFEVNPSEAPLQIMVSAAPEPATWSLLLCGVALAGAGLRRARGRSANSRDAEAA
jgi:hypothetical protein